MASLGATLEFYRWDATVPRSTPQATTTIKTKGTPNSACPSSFGL